MNFLEPQPKLAVFAVVAFTIIGKVRRSLLFRRQLQVIPYESAAAAAVKFEAPAPTKVVKPMGLSRRLEGATVTLRFTVDESGKPRDIQVLAPHNGALTRNLVSAVSQWEFTPGRKNGKAVSTHVELPVKLVDS
jgi:TonB family protein